MKAHAGVPFFFLATLGCSAEVRDTEGRVYSVECKREKCALVQRDATATLAVRTTGRLIVACPEDGSQPTECRALTCDGNSGCQKLGGDDASCIDGLCQVEGRPLTSDDRMALCLAGTGAWSGSPEQRSRVALALGCRPPCEVPDQCEWARSGR